MYQPLFSHHLTVTNHDASICEALQQSRVTANIITSSSLTVPSKVSRRCPIGHCHECARQSNQEGINATANDPPVPLSGLCVSNGAVTFEADMNSFP